MASCDLVTRHYFVLVIIYVKCMSLFLGLG